MYSFGFWDLNSHITIFSLSWWVASLRICYALNKITAIIREAFWYFFTVKRSHVTTTTRIKNRGPWKEAIYCARALLPILAVVFIRGYFYILYEFSGFVTMFEVCRLNKKNHMLNSFHYPSCQEPVELTEAENGTVNVVKNIYKSHVVLQYNYQHYTWRSAEYVSNWPLSILKLPHTARRLYINHYFAMFGISCRSFSLCLMSCILRSSHSAYNNMQRLWHGWPVFCKSKFEHCMTLHTWFVLF
jgi:nitrate reductase NapE component